MWRIAPFAGSQWGSGSAARPFFMALIGRLRIPLPRLNLLLSATLFIFNLLLNGSFLRAQLFIFGSLPLRVIGFGLLPYALLFIGLLLSSPLLCAKLFVLGSLAFGVKGFRLLPEAHFMFGLLPFLLGLSPLPPGSLFGPNRLVVSAHNGFPPKKSLFFSFVQESGASRAGLCSLPGKPFACRIFSSRPRSQDILPQHSI